MTTSAASTDGTTLGALLAPAAPWQIDAIGEVDYYDMESFVRAEPRTRSAGTVPADAHYVLPGDVLVSTRPSGPRRAWVVGEQRGRPQVASVDWLALRSDALDPAYARQLFVSNEFELACRRLVPSRRRRGATQSVRLANVSIALPGKLFQTAAARVMDRADALRGERAVVVERGRELAQSLFDEQFGAAAHTLAPLASLLSDAPCRGADVSLDARGRFAVIRAADMIDGEVNLVSARYVSQSDAELARTALVDGDVLLAREPGRIEVRVAIARPGDALWFMHAKLWRLRADVTQVMPEYLRAWLMSATGQRALAQAWLASGARQPVAQRLAGIAIPLPPIEAQQQFAERLHAAERLTGSVMASAQRLDALLGTLRDLAFRGELLVELAG